MRAALKAMPATACAGGPLSATGDPPRLPFQASPCPLQVPLDRVRRCFDLYYGGVPWLVLEMLSTPDYYNEPDEAVMLAALRSTSLDQVRRVHVLQGLTRG